MRVHFQRNEGGGFHVLARQAKAFAVGAGSRPDEHGHYAVAGQSPVQRPICGPFDELKIVGQLMSRLVKLKIIRTRHSHHDDTTIFALLDRSVKLRSFGP